MTPTLISEDQPGLRAQRHLEWALKKAGIRASDVERHRADIREALGDNPDPGDVYDLLCREAGNQKPRRGISPVWQRVTRAMGPEWGAPRTAKAYLPVGGLPEARAIEDQFKSQWESRTARALTRLGIGWEYEPGCLTYRSFGGRNRRYIPDFKLPDLKFTYIEVKGPNGPDEADIYKMRAVQARHPRLTLLLWDADVIEFLEDATGPEFVVGLVRTTVFI